MQSRVADPSADPADSESVSVISLANVLLRHRILLVILPAIALMTAVGYAALRPVEYAADSTFMPQTTSPDRSRVAGLAEQFGVDVGGGSAGDNVQFYAELLTSRDLLREVVETTYQIESESGEELRGGTLIELLDVEGETPEARIRATVGRLREQIGIDPQPTTSTVRLTTRASRPELAVQINERMLELANDFNLRRRQSQARAEREFVEARMERAREELQEAEHAMETFLQQNRRYADSPQLMFEFRRLQRNLETKQQVFNSLATAFEQARISEVRNTPVLTILDAPDGSARRIRMNLVTTLIIAIVLGLLVATVIAFAMDYVRQERRKNPQDYAEFRDLGRSVLGQFGFFRNRVDQSGRSGNETISSAPQVDGSNRE